MGAAGHKFIAHTKALSPAPSNADNGWGLPPHPVRARPGQRYWQRRGKHRRLFVVRRVTATAAIGVRLDGEGEPVRVPLVRLLARRADDQGSSYQFQGFAPRSYRTCAFVAELDESEAVLLLPEWHPGRPLRLLDRLLPEDAREPGRWISLKCDLSASSPARLQPNSMRVADPDQELSRFLHIHHPQEVSTAGLRAQRCR